MLSCSVLANDKTSSTEQLSDVGTNYSIKPGYKHFRFNCKSYDLVYTKEYTVSNDKKEITLIDKDGEWVQFINPVCKITMVKS